jgi:hypothetical protein
LNIRLLKEIARQARRAEQFAKELTNEADNDPAKELEAKVLLQGS